MPLVVGVGGRPAATTKTIAMTTINRRATAKMSSFARVNPERRDFMDEGVFA
jgi:hypothetical protein